MTERLTSKEYQAQSSKPKRSKYGSKRTMVDGIMFDSKAEAARYTFLKERLDAGEISHLELQPVFKLSNGTRPVLIKSKGYPNGRQVKYVADFAYFCPVENKRIIEDCKGFRTKEFILKKAFVEAQFPGVKIREV